MTDLTGNEDLAKILAALSESMKSMWDELSSLKCGTTQIGITLPSTGSQHSDLDFGAGSSFNPPPLKRSKTDEEVEDEDEPLDEGDLELTGQLVTLSQGAATFLKAAFSAKLKNENRKAKATKNGIPDSRWTRCPIMDAVVAANIPPGAKRADKSASHLQQFWLDAAIPLVLMLERVEELNLHPEAISAIQTSLQLMGNTNNHNTSAHRNAILMQLNPRLKPLFSDADFKDLPPSLLGESFGNLAKEQLNAATALKKTTYVDRGKNRYFQKGHPKKSHGRGGGNQSSSQY